MTSYRPDGRHRDNYRARMAELTAKQQEGRRNRNKGTGWMRDCITALRAAGLSAAHLVASTHRSDIAGVGRIAVECKDTTRWDDILQYIDQAQFDSAERNDGSLPVVWKKTRGTGDPMRGLIIMQAGDFWSDQLARQQRDAEYAELALDQLRAKLGGPS